MKQTWMGLLVLAVLATCATAGEIDWIKNYEDGLKKAKATGKPMFLDFFTDW